MSIRVHDWILWLRMRERNDDMDALKTILVFIKAIMSVLIPVMFVITAVATAYGCLAKLIILRMGGE